MLLSTVCMVNVTFLTVCTTVCMVIPTASVTVCMNTWTGEAISITKTCCEHVCFCKPECWHQLFLCTTWLASCCAPAVAEENAAHRGRCELASSIRPAPWQLPGAWPWPVRAEQRQWQPFLQESFSAASVAGTSGSPWASWAAAACASAPAAAATGLWSGSASAVCFCLGCCSYCCGSWSGCYCCCCCCCCCGPASPWLLLRCCYREGWAWQLKKKLKSLEPNVFKIATAKVFWFFLDR